MKSPTVGIKKDVLVSWLKVTDFSQSDLAEKLQVSKGRVSQLIHSDVEPSAHLIAKLMLVTQLPFDRLFYVREEESPDRAERNGRRSA